MKKSTTISIILLTLFLSACSNNNEANISESVENSNNTEEQTADVNNNTEDVNNKVNDEETSEVSSENNEIKVVNIKADDTITSPVKIEGEASADFKNLIVELQNSNHDVLVTETVQVKSDGSFAITLYFEFSGTKEGFIAVYENEENAVEIPVKFE